MKNTAYKVKIILDDVIEYQSYETFDINFLNFTDDDLKKLEANEVVSIKKNIIDVAFKINKDKLVNYKKGDTFTHETSNDQSFYILEVNDTYYYITKEELKDTKTVTFVVESFTEEIEMPFTDFSYMEKPKQTREGYQDPRLKYIFDNKNDLS